MEFNIQNIISILNEFTPQKKEIGEQDAAPAASAPTGGGGGGGKAAPKWHEVVGGPKRGKANMLGKGGEKWETGLTRGVANQVW
jgi:hypothetical protein